MNKFITMSEINAIISKKSWFPFNHHFPEFAQKRSVTLSLQPGILGPELFDDNHVEFYRLTGEMKVEQLSNKDLNFISNIIILDTYNSIRKWRKKTGNFWLNKTNYCYANKN